MYLGFFDCSSSEPVDLLDLAEQARFVGMNHSRALDFMAGRYVAKTMASHLFQVPANHVEIHVSENGKPYFSDFKDWTVSIAHHSKKVICSIARLASGVDVQSHRSKRDIGSISALSFLDSECLSVQLSKDPVASFYAHWVIKEAMLKGEGSSVWSMSELPAIVFEAPDHSNVKAPIGVVWELLDLPMGCFIGLSSRQGINIESLQWDEQFNLPAASKQWALAYLAPQLAVPE